jgi:hypothetical protein
MTVAHLGLVAITLAIYRATRAVKPDLELRRKISTLFENLSMKNPVSIYWNVIMLFRWTVTILILVQLRNYYSFQISSLLFMSFWVQISAMVW